MQLLNIWHEGNFETLNVFSKGIEDKINLNGFSGVEMLFAYGYGETVTNEWLNECIESIQAIPEGRFILPIVIYGRSPLFTYSIEVPPVFSFDREGIDSFPRLYNRADNKGSYICCGNPIEVYETEEDSVEIKPLFSPTGSKFGEIIMPSKGSGYEYPVVFLYYDFLRHLHSGVSIPSKRIVQKAFKYILELAVFKLMPDIFPEPEHEYEEKKYDSRKDIEIFLSRVAGEAHRRLKRIENEAHQTKAKLLTLLRQYEEQKFALESFDNSDKMREQLAKVNEMDRVIWSDIRGDKFRVLTERLDIHKGTQRIGGDAYALGHLLIEVGLFDAKVQFNNLTRNVQLHNDWSGYAHPHVTQSTNSEERGRVCLGQISKFIPSLVHDVEFVPLTELLINFAESVNYDDSAGKNIKSWPITL